MEERLIHSENISRKTNRIARIGGWSINLLKDQLTWTDQTYEIHELPKSTPVTVEKAINFYHPDDRRKITELVKFATNEGKSFDTELRIITANGKQLWVRAIGEATLEKGQIIEVSGTFQDINIRREAESLLQQKMNELERFNKLMTGRELRMIELKQEVNGLLKKFGEKEKYRVVS